MKTVVFLVSGGGGNFKFFYFALKHNLISGIKLSLIADRECDAIEFARVNDIENFLISYNRADPYALNCVLEKINPDVIVTNWHKIIDESTVSRFFGKLINLHYSLLPAFGGLIGIEPIRRAYENGCKFIGPTCHLVDQGVDTGRILSQAVFNTERPFEAAITLMFRKGCLVLLSGIQKKLGAKLVVVQSTRTDGTYSPELGFDESLFDERFWMDILGD
jgi:phosphoribosylglycinamide formyltransferase-1